MLGHRSIANSFMLLCFCTAALLVGVRTVQDTNFEATDANGSVRPNPLQRLSLNRRNSTTDGRLPIPNPLPRVAANPLEPTAGLTGFKASTESASEGAVPPEFALTMANPSAHRRNRSPSTWWETHVRGAFIPAVATMQDEVMPLPDQVMQVVVDLSDRQTYLYQGTQEIGRFPVAIGKAGWETPAGQFQVIDMQVDPHWQHPITGADIPPGPGNPLGSRWIAFLPMSDGVIGFHGTSQTELLGQAVSHGCIRMRNSDIEAMFDQIRIGTTVIVQP